MLTLPATFVFNNFSIPAGPALAGAIGTWDCNCTALYPADADMAKACEVRRSSCLPPLTQCIPSANHGGLKVGLELELHPPPTSPGMLQLKLCLALLWPGPRRSATSCSCLASATRGRRCMIPPSPALHPFPWTASSALSTAAWQVGGERSALAQQGLKSAWPEACCQCSCATECQHLFATAHFMW